MDVLAELLPSSYLVKPESTAKDKQQKNRNYRKSYRSFSNDEQNFAGQSSIELLQADNWDQVERRSGKDRREYLKNRGRWLESRAEKDRRQMSKAIQIKI